MFASPSRITRLVLAATLFAATCSASAVEPAPLPGTTDLEIQDAKVTYRQDIDMVVFELRVNGTAGATVPVAAGGMDGAPVLGYVFPTTLKPEQVGFAPVDGILALAATSHPDFDDTPLWDEDGDGDPTNAGDAAIFHTHWVVLVADERVAGGLSVRAVERDPASVLPPTAPGMPIYLDSPGFPAVMIRDRLRIPVPAWRIRDLEAFNFDAVTAYMQVNTTDEGRPTLGVYAVYSVLSGDLSLPQRFRLTGKGNRR